MQIDLKKIFPRKAQPGVTIRVLRPMSLKVDGAIRHIDADEKVTVDLASFQALDTDDREVINHGQPLCEVADPSPSRPEPQAPPAAYKALPACFSEFHAMQQSLAVAAEHIDLIRAKRLEIFGVDVRFAQAQGTILAGTLQASPDRHNKNWHSTLRPFNMDDPATKKIDRLLTFAEGKAVSHLRQLRESTEIPLQRLFLSCGDFRIATAQRLQTVIDELSATGFQIFAVRLAALGLHEHHVRKLYAGSADAVRYGNQGAAYQSEVRFGGMDETTGEMRVYSDMDPDTAASYAIREMSRISELEPLLKTARAELSRAQKVAA